MSFLKIAAGSSGAREVAASLLILWIFYVGWLHFWIEAEQALSYKDFFGTITTAIFTFALGAFGVPSVMNRLQPTSTPAPRVPLKGGREIE